MRKLITIIFTVVSFVLVAGCIPTHYFDAVFAEDDKVHSLSADEQQVSIPYKYEETKTSDGEVLRLFRLRTIIDGVEGEAMIPGYEKNEDDNYWSYVDGYHNAVLVVTIPSNTTGHERPVAVEISVDDGWDGAEQGPEAAVWKEWKTIYKAIQASF